MIVMRLLLITMYLITTKTNFNRGAASEQLQLKPNTMKELTNKQAAIGLAIIIIICLLADNL